MEDDGHTASTDAGAMPAHSPPPAPNPHRVVTTADVEPRNNEKSDEPLRLQSEEWDITSISPLAALRMLVQALESLAEATGDVPATPPVSRGSTPRRTNVGGLARRTSSFEAAECPPSINIGSPEAHHTEPIGATAEDHHVQHAQIARRFFSKVAPPFSLSEYLLRIHKWCPHSAAVYLTATAWCQRLCVAEFTVPATNRTIHRLSLAAIRVAAKALEDNKWSQDRIGKVGGVGLLQLMNLEVTLCFLLDFELWVDDKMLARRMFLLQQAAKQGLSTSSKLGDDFKLRLPVRRKTTQVLAMAA